jgi:hypothetical protein
MPRGVPFEGSIFRRKNVQPAKIAKLASFAAEPVVCNRYLLMAGELVPHPDLRISGEILGFLNCFRGEWAKSSIMDPILMTFIRSSPI